MKVRLIRDQLAKALSGVKHEAFAAVIGRDPGTLSRYLSGQRHPRIEDAHRIAEELNLEPEVVIEGSPTTLMADKAHDDRFVRHHAPGLVEFGKDVRHLLSFIHFEERFDGLGRENRRAVLTARAGVRGYGAFRIRGPAQRRAEIIVAFRYGLPGSPMLIDYGRIRFGHRTIVASELWTLRCTVTDMPEPDADLWVRTWLDGRGSRFVLRSSEPFELVDQTLTVARPPAGAPTVIFRRTGFHHRPNSSLPIDP